MNSLNRLLLLSSILIGMSCSASFKTRDLNPSALYSDVTWPMTHNGTVSVKRPLLPKEAQVWNQDKSLAEQLEAGIRATKIPLHESGGTIKACHGLHKGDVQKEGSKLYENLFGKKTPTFLQEKITKIVEKIDPCLADLSAQPLVKVLNGIASFLKNNKGEIFTLLLEDQTRDHQRIYDALKQAGLTSLVHVQNPSQPWPTLGQMIANDKRLVVLVTSSDKENRNFPELNKAKDFLYSTQFTFKNIESLKENDEIRGNAAFAARSYKPQNKLMNMQHFITLYIGGSPNEAEKANQYDVILKRALKLKKKAGTKPNFISVDFYERGNGGLFSAVRTLNEEQMEKDRGSMFIGDRK